MNTSTSKPEFITVVGCKGMLGRAWCQLLERKQIEHQGLDLPQLDITDPASIESNIPANSNIIVNCAAWTDVDGAEENEDKAMTLNAEAVKNLAAQSQQFNATLIHYSTDYVFNGAVTEPYTTEQPHDPINAYGRTKAAGEAALLNSPCNHLLIRTSWLYAPWGNNFVRTMHKLTAERNNLQVVNDQRGNPTSAQSLAGITLKLISQNQTGIFHVTDRGHCTWYDFATTIANLANHDCEITPCTSETFPRPAARPTYSVLDLSKTIEVIGEIPDWKTNLSDVLKNLEA